MQRLSTVRFRMAVLVLAGLLAVNVVDAPAASGGESKTWRTFSIPVPELSYFDVQDGGYRVLEASPLKLIILSVSNL